MVKSMELQQAVDTDAQQLDEVDTEVEANEEDGYSIEDMYPDEQGQDEGEEADLSNEGAEGSEPEPAAEPVKAPNSWSKEDAAVFASLPPEAQAIVNRRETERDNFLKKSAFEASQTRNTVANEAREIIVKMHDNHAAQLKAYADMFTPQPPDQRLLYTDNQNDMKLYHQQKAAYDAGVAQQQELHQRIRYSQEQAEEARRQSQQAELASDAQRLKEQLPEWFDPSAGQELKQRLQKAGSELGYPDELMSEANSVDILALKKYADACDERDMWKSKYQAVMGKKMADVRSHRKPPTVARPGNGSAAQAVVDPVKLLYPND